jgi:anti-sigma regulatory factor (Ser/Thr protein kinase)
MFDNLNVRNKCLAVAAMPVNVLVIVTLWAAIGGQYGLAIVAMAGAGLTMAATLKATGGVLRRLASLQATADELGDALPGMLSTITHGPASGVSSPPGTQPSDQPGPSPATDELGQLEASLATIKPRLQEALEQECSAISRNLAAMVKNLARRNQSLLDRQIEHIDWLEAKEQDPERLEQLFKLDHLATRMRRSSESVLVLGGAESTRHRGGPAPVADVLRVAMGETEDYRNIRLRSVDEVMITGGPAFDLAHLLAEVLENATQFSPPESPVELHATTLDDGNYLISVIDRGVGMDQRQLEAANAVVADPPEISLAVGHSVGFIVMGRLARRLGAMVELSATAGSGVTVEVTVPASIVSAATPTASPALAASLERAATAKPAGAPERAASSTPASPPADGPLSRLLGLDEAQLPESAGWAAPAVNTGRAKPLRARDGAGAAVPPSLKPATARAEQEPRAGAQQAEPAPVDPGVGDGGETAGTGTNGPARNTSAAAANKPESVRPPAPVGPSRTAKTLAEAIPTGAAFDSGVEGLLDAAGGAASREPTPTNQGSDGAAAKADDSTWTPPAVEPTTPNGGGELTKRQRGATSVPTNNGPRARASARKPEEIRSMITRYRDGIRGPGAASPDAPVASVSPPAPIDAETLDAVESALRSGPTADLGTDVHSDRLPTVLAIDPSEAAEPDPAGSDTTPTNGTATQSGPRPSSKAKRRGRPGAAPNLEDN